jgi:hypothetical protein
MNDNREPTTPPASGDAEPERVEQQLDQTEERRRRGREKKRRRWAR